MQDDKRKPKGLTHNPFARLRADGKPAQPSAREVANPTAPMAPLVSKGRIIVRREKKGHGGKTVTIAEGEGLLGADLTALAREAAQALGVGARTEDGALQVQGDQSDRFVTWLAERGFGPISRGN
ncbi:MAG: translation initiation factor [Planctomycetota bacterium]|nr:translation initiation factor [Planctomycetota bacterium]